MGDDVLWEIAYKLLRTPFSMSLPFEDDLRDALVAHRALGVEYIPAEITAAAAASKVELRKVGERWFPDLRAYAFSIVTPSFLPCAQIISLSPDNRINYVALRTLPPNGPASDRITWDISNAIMAKLQRLGFEPTIDSSGWPISRVTFTVIRERWDRWSIDERTNAVTHVSRMAYDRQRISTGRASPGRINILSRDQDISSDRAALRLRRESGVNLLYEAPFG